MAYPESFLRLVVLGTLFTNEIFSYSLNLRRQDFNAPVPDAVPQGVIDAVTAFHTYAGVMTSNAARLTGVKLNHIGPDGRYVSDGETVLHEYNPTVAGTGGAVKPPQCAVAVTLATEANRGRAARGRFYLPNLTTGLDNDGRISTTSAENIALAATTFIEALHTALPGWRVAVFSRIGEGTVRSVTHVEVGRVIDTMRSRRNALDEARLVGEPLLP